MPARLQEWEIVGTCFPDRRARVNCLFIVQKNFVQTVRAVELILGIAVPGTTPAGIITSAANVSEALITASTKTSLFNADVLAALVDAGPMFTYVVEQLGLSTALGQSGLRESMAARSPLVTK